MHILTCILAIIFSRDAPSAPTPSPPLTRGPDAKNCVHHCSDLFASSVSCDVQINLRNFAEVQTAYGSIKLFDCTAMAFSQFKPLLQYGGFGFSNE
jgi:hypothetical protein